MTTSKMIAGLIGPTLVAIGAAILFNLSIFPAMIEQATRDPGLVFLTGILLFVVGLAIVRAHNNRAGGWPLMLTVLGWLAILGGLIRMFFPARLGAIAASLGQGIIAVAVIMLVIGAFLSFKAYSRD